MRALALIFAVACSTGALAASPMIMLTVEGAAASADRVVVGRVKSVATVNLPQAPHFNSGNGSLLLSRRRLRAPPVAKSICTSRAIISCPFRNRSGIARRANSSSASSKEAVMPDAIRSSRMFR